MSAPLVCRVRRASRRLMSFYLEFPLTVYDWSVGLIPPRHILTVRLSQARKKHLAAHYGDIYKRSPDFSFALTAAFLSQFDIETICNCLIYVRLSGQEQESTLRNINH